MKPTETDSGLWVWDEVNQLIVLSNRLAIANIRAQVQWDIKRQKCREAKAG